MKKHLAPYFYDDIKLKLLDVKDLNDTLQWRNYPEHRKWFNSTHKLLCDEHKEWFNNYLKKEDDFIFIVMKDNEKCGQLSIYDVNSVTKEANFGRFLVNPAHAGMGLMKKSCQAALALAKNILKLEKLRLEVKVENDKAIHIYKYCGFASNVVINGFLAMEIKI